jgi:hypothetical protein
MLTNLFNKRKREIERLNSVIQKLIIERNLSETVFLDIKSHQLEIEKELRASQIDVYNLKNEVNYLKMQLKVAKDSGTTKFY